jgi:hypothetical protein
MGVKKWRGIRSGMNNGTSMEAGNITTFRVIIKFTSPPQNAVPSS